MVILLFMRALIPLTKASVFGALKKTEKHSWQTSSSSKLGIKVNSKIKVPLVGEFGMEVSGEFTQSAAEGTEITTKETMTYSFPVNVPKMTKMKVTAVVRSQTLVQHPRFPT